jgi:P-type Ca2+ transporter type 2C
MPIPVHALAPEAALKSLRSSPDGLAVREAQARLARFGPNELRTSRSRHLLRRIVEPFISPFVGVLIVAGAINFFLGHLTDTLIVLIVVLINAAIFWFQQYTSGRVLAALERGRLSPARVRRGGAVIEIPMAEIVPGDIVLISEGDQVPADGRMLEARGLEVDEAKLTGESQPVSKSIKATASGAPLFDRTDMVYQGTVVAAGQGLFVASGTGPDTELGRIAALSQEEFDPPPVQKKIDRLTYYLIAAVALVASLTFLAGTIRGESLDDMLRLSLALSVSAVPEGLPIAIAIVLLLGVEKLARQGALVRKLSALETLGAVTLVATDKTGTLTESGLTVAQVWPRVPGTEALVRSGALWALGETSSHRADPIDRAIREAVIGAPPARILRSLPFRQTLRLSAAIVEVDGERWLYVKGAPEALLERSRLPRAEERSIHAQLEAAAREGHRVIAVARKRYPARFAGWERLEWSGLEFLGLVIFQEHVREEAPGAVRATREAGIAVAMLTGDHPETARSVARSVGIDHEWGVMTGAELDLLSEAELTDVSGKTRIYARVLPEHKHALLGEWRKSDIAAMTGDGVNDAPALVKADVGIALGSGTDAAKEAADLILLDDNYATIVPAIRHGRVAYANIRKMVFYLLSTNLGEALTVVASFLVGLPVPVTAGQILWINLVTDTASVIPIGLEPPERGVMHEPPRAPDAPLLGRVLVTRMLLVASLMAISALGIFALYLPEGLAKAQTMAFLVLVVMQWANAFNARSETRSILSRGRRNTKLLIGIGLALVLQILVFTTPLGGALGVVSPDLEDLLWLILPVVATLVLVEAHKAFVRARRPVR